jgi:hypothetical protein
MLNSRVTFGYTEDAIIRIIYLKQEYVPQFALNGCDVICEAPDLV